MWPAGKNILLGQARQYALPLSIPILLRSKPGKDMQSSAKSALVQSAVMQCEETQTCAENVNPQNVLSSLSMPKRSKRP